MSTVIQHKKLFIIFCLIPLALSGSNQKPWHQNKISGKVQHVFPLKKFMNDTSERILTLYCPPCIFIKVF